MDVSAASSVSSPSPREEELQLDSQRPSRGGEVVGANGVVVNRGLNVEAAPPDAEELSPATPDGDEPSVPARSLPVRDEGGSAEDIIGATEGAQGEVLKEKLVDVRA